MHGTCAAENLCERITASDNIIIAVPRRIFGTDWSFFQRTPYLLPTSNPTPPILLNGLFSMGDTSMQPHPASLLSRARRPENAQDWEPHKEMITNLYQRMELREVMKIMKDQYKFAPTLNQYKKRISKWGLDKKRIKHAEYEAMVKKKRKRELEAPGKGSQFILHGEEVPQSKITRFEERMQRSGKINEEDTLSDVATPASLTCLTPKPTTLNIAELAGHPMTVDRTLPPGRPQSPDELWFPMPTRIGDKTRPASSSTGVIRSPVLLHRRISSPSPQHSPILESVLFMQPNPIIQSPSLEISDWFPSFA